MNILQCVIVTFPLSLLFFFPTLLLKLFSLLNNPDLGSLAAEGFSLLMSDSVDVLNRSCHADIRIMYRQRFFSENSAKLVQGFNAVSPGTAVWSGYTE